MSHTTPCPTLCMVLPFTSFWQPTKPSGLWEDSQTAAETGNLVGPQVDCGSNGNRNVPHNLNAQETHSNSLTPAAVTQLRETCESKCLWAWPLHNFARCGRPCCAYMWWQSMSISRVYGCDCCTKEWPRWTSVSLVASNSTARQGSNKDLK